MFHSFFRYLQGYLRIRIKGYSPERFINLCKNKNIDIWGLGYNLDSYEMYIKVKDFRKIKPLLKKTVTKVCILERFGLPFFFHNYRKRNAFFAGIGICVLIVYVMTLFLWKIDFQGNQRFTDEVLMEYLTSEKITHGMLKRKVDCEQIAKNMRKEFDDIIWVTASLEGTCLTVHVKENTDTFRVNTEEEEPSDIVADKNGIIRSMVTRSGVPKVKVGDEIKAGDVLVSGTVEVLNDAKEVAGQYYVLADADIVMETIHPYEDFIPKKYEKKRYTERKRDLWTFMANGLYVSLGLPQNKFANKEIHTFQTQCKLDDNFYLPIFVGKKEILEYELVPLEYSKEEMETLLHTRFDAYCKTLQEKAVIVERNLQITQEGGGLKAVSNLILEESVGIHRKIVDFSQSTMIE